MNIILNDFKNYLLINTSEKTTLSYLNVLSQFFNSYSEFNQTTVDNFLSDIIQKHNAPRTFNIKMSALKKYALFAKQNDLIFPKAKKINHKNKTAFTNDELENEIIPFIPLIFKNAEQQILRLRFLFLTCVRVSEMVNIKKSDINWETGRLTIYGKGNKYREIFLCKELLAMIKKESDSHPYERIFNLTEHAINYTLDEINKQLNYKIKLTPHMFRHAGAWHLYKQTNDIMKVSKVLGHTSVETTQIYLGTCEADMEHFWKKIKYTFGEKIKQKRKK